MRLVFYLLLLRLARQRFYEVQIEGSVDAVALIVQPQSVLGLLEVFYQVGLEDDLLLSGFGGGQAELNLVLAEELFELSPLYLVSDVLLFNAQLILLEIDARDRSQVALLRFLPSLLEHLEPLLGLLVEEEGDVEQLLGPCEDLEVL